MQILQSGEGDGSIAYLISAFESIPNGRFESASSSVIEAYEYSQHAAVLAARALQLISAVLSRVKLRRPVRHV